MIFYASMRYTRDHERYNLFKSSGNRKYRNLLNNIIANKSHYNKLYINISTNRRSMLNDGLPHSAPTDLVLGSPHPSTAGYFLQIVSQSHRKRAPFGHNVCIIADSAQEHFGSINHRFVWITDSPRDVNQNMKLLCKRCLNHSLFIFALFNVTTCLYTHLK